MFAVGCLTLILWNYSEFFWFLGAPAALGIVLSFVIRCVNQNAQEEIQLIGAELR